MPHRLEARPDLAEQIGIAGRRRARIVLRPDQHALQRLRREQLPQPLVRCDRDGLVRRVREPARVDQRRVGGVGGGDGDAAARERGDERSHHGGVVVPVCRRGGVVDVVAEVAADVEVLDLGPVGGEGCERGDGGVGEGGAA